MRLRVYPADVWRPRAKLNSLVCECEDASTVCLCVSEIEALSVGQTADLLPLPFPGTS